ncbi:hypothetical protein LWC35_18950 [Pseudonocardia kujensis]|uniref:hypothetical protein n=1 Tax=Pseudonocardia kujensis TaxID=1128675 RepID=UPI001E2ED22A|nr:hypothetical protein [Pseudonocardia kujensis]MCE0764965.1 hypothetical protein [Pseudonocardia kujensis]
MTTLPESDRVAPATPTARTLPWWGFGLANVAVVLVLAIASWWLLVDPRWSAIGAYPQPFTAALFWTIISVVWVAFTCAWTGPSQLGQPVRGLVGIALTLVLGIGITALLAYGWGRVDPSFAAAREGGAGFATGNLIVLFAFFFYVMAVLNWGQAPWAGRLNQPWLGLAELGALVLPTLVVYGVFALPGLAVWGDQTAAWFSTTTLIGWFYCLIVAAVMTGLLTENLPWKLVGSPGRVVLASLVGNVVLGLVLFVVLRGLATVLMGSSNAALIGDALSSHAAELGVCWVFWMIAWANVFGNRPTNRGTTINVLVRVVGTLVLAMATYVVYYFVLAGPVLHEPQVAGAMHGDALGFMDWMILWLLWYVLFLGSWGLPKAREAETTAVQ